MSKTKENIRKQSFQWKKLFILLTIFAICALLFSKVLSVGIFGQSEQSIQLQQTPKMPSKIFLEHQKKVWESLLIAMLPFYNQLQFRNPLQSLIVPSTIQIRTEDIKINLNEGLHWTLRNLPYRPSLDLVCVVDVSGSMQGEKIEFMRSSLIEMIEFLADDDRISIIQFHSYPQVIVDLTYVKDKRQMLVDKITSLKASGGTNIQEAMKEAFILLLKRKDHNGVTSVFLLTDGLDNFIQGDALINKINSVNQNTNFSGNIHTFGYGSDHDSPFLSSCARKNGGEYYYIEDVQKIRKYFINAFGQILSIAFPRIQIKLTIDKLAQKIFDNNIRIKKVFGDMWIKGLVENEFIIELKEFQYGVQKDFVLELEIPYLNDSLIDSLNSLSLFNLEVSGQVNKIEHTKNFPIKFLFAKSAEVIDQTININEKVLVNYYRMKLVEVFAEVEQLILKQQQAQAREYLEGFKQQLLAINEGKNLFDIKVINIQIYDYLQEMINEIEKALIKQSQQGAEHYFKKESMRRTSQKFHPDSTVSASASQNSLQRHMDEL